jgi:hypothetical protein
MAALALLAAAPLNAQSPKGWKSRSDNSTRAADPDGAGAIKFVEEKGGFHATNPQAATYWNPANMAAGNYALKGTFTVLKPTSHSEYYGLVFGGSDLEGARQSYLYFLVAGDGTWLLKSRTGNNTENLAGPTRNAAVKQPDPSGRATNALAVRVLADKIEYVVNGTVVYTSPKTGKTAKTDGVYGLRVNHLLEVQVDGFALSKL